MGGGGSEGGVGLPVGRGGREGGEGKGMTENRGEF